MQYSKFMIDLVYQIRKNADPTFRPKIKLSNPDLLDNLIEIYFESHNKALRADIENLLTLAGSAWRDTLLEQRRNSELRAPVRAEHPVSNRSAVKANISKATQAPAGRRETTPGADAKLTTTGTKQTEDRPKVRLYRGVKTPLGTH